MKMTHPLIIELEPLAAGGVDVRIVVAAIDAAAVHEDAVQPVLVAHRPVCIFREVLAVVDVQVQDLRKLVPVIDLRMGICEPPESQVLPYPASFRISG